MWRSLEAVWNLFYFSSLLRASTDETFAGIPLNLILLDWNLVYKTTRLIKESQGEWLPPSIGFVKLNLDGCSLGNPSQIGIGGLITDHCGRTLRAFSKPVGQGLAIAKILTLLEGLSLAKALGFSKFLVEDDLAVFISWVTKKERDPWKF